MGIKTLKKGRCLMKKKVFCLVLSFIAVLTFSTGIASAQTFKWRLQSIFARGDFSADLLPSFCDEVKKKSNGRLIITPFYAGEVVAYDATFKAVGQGIVEMAQTCGTFWKAEEPVLALQFGPILGFRGSLKQVEDLVKKADLYNQWEKAYARHNIYMLGINTYGPYPAIASNKPIRSLKDFKGVKVRAMLEIGDLMKEFGASPGYIPGGEIYMALKLGTFDAAVYSIDAIRGMKWHEVMKYYILPYWTDWYFGDVLVNQDAWNKLPPDLKKIMKEAMANYAKKNEEVMIKEKEILVSQAKKLGYEVITWPESEMEQLRKVAVQKYWPKWIKENEKKCPECYKVFEITKKHYNIKY